MLTDFFLQDNYTRLEEHFPGFVSSKLLRIEEWMREVGESHTIKQFWLCGG